MRILVVSQYFWPENFRINDLCSEMVVKGHSVTVLTGEPNYPSGTKDGNYLLNKQKYNEFKGCKVVRVPLVARGDGKLRLILNYISFFLFASTVGIWRLRKQKFDVIFVCQLSPVTSAIPAILYRKLYGTPVVMWVLDLWPDSLKAVGVVKSDKALLIINKLVQFIYNRCDLILGQSKSFVSEIQSNSSGVNVDYFPSWAENVFEEKGNSTSVFLSDDNTFDILFAGNVGEAQDFSNLLSALTILKIREVKVKFHVVGDGRYLETLKEKIFENDLGDYIKLWGRFPLEDMPKFFSSADVLFVSLKNNPTFSMTIPGKVQSYMMAEKPILASLSGDGADVILQSSCGLVSMPGDFKLLADNVESMINLSDDELKLMGGNGKAYASDHFNRSVLMSNLIDWFERVSTERIGNKN
jgi:glycosyltransferase involved in cell wall biosynthesis